MLGLLLTGMAMGALHADVLLKAGDFTHQVNTDKMELVEAKEVRIKGGDTLRIQLPLAGGTGYQWQALGPDYGPLVLKQTLIGRPMRPMPGAPVEQLFVFQSKAIAPGSSQQVTLVFNLRRPFEGVGTKFVQVRVVAGDS